jgi:hypothetical protein
MVHKIGPFLIDEVRSAALSVGVEPQVPVSPPFRSRSGVAGALRDESPYLVNFLLTFSEVYLVVQETCGERT